MDLHHPEEITPDDLDAHLDRVGERKLDGVRAYTENGRLHTRRGTDITAALPEIDPPEHHVFDGEIVTADFQFETALSRIQTEDTFDVEMKAERHPAKLVVFDVLAVNGGDVRDEPLTERKELIAPSIPEGSGLVEITTYDDVLDLWDRATDQGWEGVVLKDPDAPYRGERTDAWLRVKDWSEATFDVVDYEHTDEGGFVVYVEIGADEPQKVAVQRPDDRREIEAGVERVEVQYLERSKNGRLRKPSFRGVA